MRIVLLPSTTNHGNTKIYGQEVAMVVLLPDSYQSGKVYPCMQFTHGMNEGGPGTVESLKNLYDSPYQVIPNDWKNAVDKYGIVGVLVQYTTFFQPASHDWVYRYIQENFSVVEKWMYQGFSWGCGSLRKYYRSSLERANRIACTVEISGTLESDSAPASWEYMAKSGGKVWAAVNEVDKKVGTSATINSVNALNAIVPGTAIYTMYDGEGHGPRNQMLSIAPPFALGGSGFVAAGENVYEWYLSILADGPRLPKATSSNPTIPTTPTTPTTPATGEAIVEYVANYPLVSLNATKTTNWQFAIRRSWTLKKAPPGVNIYTNIWQGGTGWITVDAKLPAKGVYEIEFKTVWQDNTESKATVVIDYADEPVPVEKKPTGYNWSTHQLIYSDGSSEVVIASFKTEKGIEYIN